MAAMTPGRGEAGGKRKRWGRQAICSSDRPISLLFHACSGAQASPSTHTLTLTGCLPTVNTRGLNRYIYTRDLNTNSGNMNSPWKVLKTVISCNTVFAHCHCLCFPVFGLLWGSSVGFVLPAVQDSLSKRGTLRLKPVTIEESQSTFSVHPTSCLEKTRLISYFFLLSSSLISYKHQLPESRSKVSLYI